MSIGQQLLDVPFGEMISSLGLAIAEAQFALDTNSMAILRQMGEPDTVTLPFCRVEYNSPESRTGDENADPLTVTDQDIQTSMLGAGFQPTFYQFAETIIEVKIAITMSFERDYSVTISSKKEQKEKYKKKTIARTTTVDASYSSKYNYTAEGSSLLRTRLVPVPPNTVVAQMIEMRTSAMQMAYDLKRQQVEAELALVQAKINAEAEEEAKKRAAAEQEAKEKAEKEKTEKK